MLLCSVSCTEDDGLEPVAPDEGTLTVTFDIAGIEGVSPTTRSEGYGDATEDYIKKIYIFREEKNTASTARLGTRAGNEGNSSPFAGYTFSEVKEITEARFTLSLNDQYNYAFVFIAYEDDYKEQGEVYVGGNTPPSSIGNTVNALYTKCFIKAIDEDQSGTGYKIYSKADNAYQPFMIYGAGFSIAGFNEESYIHETVTFKRQMGAVTFKVPEDTDISGDVTCRVLTDYYRLYLSQILEANQSGTINHESDYAGVGFYPFIDCTFEGGQTETKGEYTFYLPCTTTRSEIDANHQDEQANFTRSASTWQEYVSLETSISWGDTRYASTTRFPIFPNRRTILTVNKDGNLESVHFTTMGGGSGDKIDVEDDWNGVD